MANLDFDLTRFPSLTPPVDRYAPPPFHDMGKHPKRFETMSCQLLDLDSRFKNAILFGLDGQTQWGIDAIAVHGDYGKAVQSSKCHASTTTAKIVEWSDDFLNEYEARWKDECIDVFILSTSATNISDTKIFAQIEVEKARFAKLGIDYEVWGPEVLTRRLQKSRETTLRFLDDVWANMLCGPVANIPSTGINAAIIAQLHATQRTLSSHVDARIAQGLVHLQEGDLAQVDVVIAEINNHETWEQLTPETQASALRLAARLAAIRKNWNSAADLAAASQVLFAQEPRLEAFFAGSRVSSAEGLRVLGTPTTLFGRQMEAGLTLDGGDFEGAANKIKILLTEEPDDPENLRLLSALNLKQGQWSQALEAAERAYQVAPTRIEIIRTVAMTRYANALSPAVELNMVVYPNPVDWEFVRTGPKSVKLLESALAAWRLLACKEQTADEAEIWTLACLATLVDRQTDAETACRDLLQRKPGQLAGIYWALTRGYGIDLHPSRDQLQQALETGEAGENEVRCYAILVHGLEGEAAVIAQLSSLHNRLGADGRKEAERWIKRMKGEAPDPDDDDPWLTDDEIQKALSLAAKDDYAEVSRHLDLYMGDGKLGFRGLPYAGMVANKGWWSALAAYADTIVRYDTAEAIALAAHIFLRTGRVGELPAFLKIKADCFPNGVLTLQLRRIEIAAHAKLGDLPQAIHLAQMLTSEKDFPDDWVQLAQLHCRSGNVQACIPILKPLLRKNTLDVLQCLEFSIAVDREDVSFAQQLWRRAMKEGIPDSHVIHALTEAYRLGLDNEASSLVVRLQQRAATGAGDAWMVSVDDLVEEIRSRRENSDNVVEMLQAGAVPIHVVPAHLILSLAELYQLNGAKPTAGVPRPLFIRNGGRPADVKYDIPWSEWRLHLDVTGLLIAFDLDLLDLIEALPNPIIVGAYLPQFLLTLERKASDQQISRVQSGKAILKAINDGRLSEYVGDTAEHCVVRHDIERVQTTQSGLTIDSIRRCLVSNGKLDAINENGKSVLDETMANYQNFAIEPIIAQRLVFEGNTLETIAGQGWLAVALENFKCEIPSESKAYIVEYQAAAEAGNSLADRVRALRDRVAIGIEAGTYVFAQPTKSAESPDGNPGEAGSLGETGLGDLLQSPAIDKGMVWVDDRYISGFVKAGSHFVVGVVEVLQALVDEGALNEVQRRQNLLKLRANGAVFIPIDSAEFLDALKAATVKDGQVVETPTLSIYRRNIATVLRLDPYLKIGESKFESLKDRPDEMLVLNAIRQSLQDCLTSIWTDPKSTPESRFAQSDYAWGAFRMEHCIRPLPVSDPGQGNRVYAALGIASLISGAQRMQLKTVKATLERQEEYLKWACHASLSRRGGVGQNDFLDLVASNLKALEEAGLSFQVEDAQAQNLIHFLRAKHIEMLPKDISDRMLSDRAFAKALDIQHSTVVSAGNQQFEAEKFWRAIVRALRQGTAKLVDTNGISLDFKSDGEAITLKSPPQTRIYEPFFSILKSEGVTARHKLQRYLDSLDILKSERDAFFQNFGRSTSLAEKAAVLQGAKAASISTTYDKVAAALGGGKSFDSTVLAPPPVKRFLHHLRLLGGSGSFYSRIETAWATLSREFGQAEAFRRLAGLPVSLSKIAHVNPGWSLLTPEGRFMSSPMAWLHLSAFCRAADESEKANRYFHDLLCSVEREVVLFLAIMDWSCKAFLKDPDWKGLLVSDKLALAWSHAHYICSLFVESPLDIGTAAIWFSENDPGQVITDRLTTSSMMDVDVAGARTIGASSLLYHGLAYVFQDIDAWDEFSVDLRSLATTTFFAGSEENVLGAEFAVRARPLVNCMDSFLSDMPSGVLHPLNDGHDRRDTWITDALAALEGDAANLEPWLVVAGVGKLGFLDQEAARIVEAYKSLDFSSVLNKPDWPNITRIATTVAFYVGGLAASSTLIGKIHELASACAIKFPGPVSLSDLDATDMSGDAAKALSAVFELVLVGARSENEVEAIEKLDQLTTAVVMAWPAAGVSARTLFDGFVRETIPDGSSGLWKTFVWLRGCQ